MEFLAAAVSLVAGVLLFLGRTAVRAVERRFDIDIDDSTRGYLEDAFEAALRYGARKAVEMAGASPAEADRVRLEAARDYVMRSVPDALARFRIDAQGVHDRLVARDLIRLEAEIGPAPAAEDGA